MKKFFFFFCFLITFQSQAQSTVWSVDKFHSNIQFAVDYMLISEVTGNVKVFDGSMIAAKEDFSDAQIMFNAEVKSLTTNNEMRDEHLMSDEFFNAEQYPSMTFKSTSFKKVKDNKYELKGELTIRDVTKNVTFDVLYGGTTKDAQGNIKAGFKATGKINRLDYNLKWNNLMDNGAPVVSNEVRIFINLIMLKTK
jgi:polyisoprenoid-binding protein YceI